MSPCITFCCAANAKLPASRRVLRRMALFLSFVTAWQPLSAEVGPPPVDGVYRIYHPDNPPWGDSKERKGFIVEIVETAFKRADIPHESVYAPWKREQTMVQKYPNSFMAPLTRVDHREAQYEWIAPVNISFLQLVTRSNVLATAPFDELKGMQVAARMESPAEFMLKDLGFSSITIVEDEEAAARMMMADRVLLWMQRGLPGHWAFERAGGELDKLRVIRFWRTPLQYLVASKGTDPKVIERLRAVLVEMQQSGEIDRIKQSYFSYPLRCDVLFNCTPPDPCETASPVEGLKNAE